MSVARRADAPPNSLARPGYNGQLHEPGGCWQFLGNGYRVYNPVLMRFHSPDSLSPFGKGGVNTYAYCSCDPVNYVDPSGQFLLPIAALMGIGSAVTGATAGVMGVQGKSKEARILGVIAGVLGVISMVAGGAHAFRSTGSTRPNRSGARVKNPDLAHGDVVILRGQDGDIVRTHGRQGVVELSPGRASTGKELARLWRGTPMGKSRNVPVEIQACRSGRGGRSVGQSFANEAGVEVIGYVDDVRVVGGLRELTVGKQPVLFRPQAGPSKAAMVSRRGASNRRAEQLWSQGRS